MGCIVCKCCENVRESKIDKSLDISENLFVLRQTHKSLSVLENVLEVCPYASQASLEPVQVHKNSGGSENRRQTCKSLSVLGNLQLRETYENIRVSKSLPELHHIQENLGVSDNLPKHNQTHNFSYGVLKDKTNLGTTASHPHDEIYFLAKDFSTENLPEKFRASEMFLYLKACIDLVVRIAVGHTSASRSEKDVIHNFRGEHSTRYGSGVVFKVSSLKNSTSLCTCPVCEASSHKQSVACKVYVITSSLMVHDCEAKSTTVDLFYVGESDRENMKTIYGSDVIHGSDLNGWCIVECVSHDKDLTNKLMDVVATEEELRIYLGLFCEEVLRSKLLRKIHVEKDFGEESGAVNELKKYPEWDERFFDEVIQERSREMFNLGGAHDVEERYNALMTEPVGKSLSNRSEDEKVNNEKESSTESDLNNDDDGSETVGLHKRALESRYFSDNESNVSFNDILSSKMLMQPHVIEVGSSESGGTWSDEPVSDAAAGEEQRDEASKNADTGVIPGGSGDMFCGTSFVEESFGEVSEKSPVDVGGQSCLIEDSDEKDRANTETPTNLSVIVCHPNGQSKQVCVKELKSDEKVKMSSLEVQCDGQKVLYHFHNPSLPSQHIGEDWSGFGFESEIAGIEVTVLYPDGTNDKCCIWQMDKKVKETKKWLLQHGGIHGPEETFHMVIKLDETVSQVMDDDKEIDYYWDDLCEAQCIYFQPVEPG